MKNIIRVNKNLLIILLYIIQITAASAFWFTSENNVTSRVKRQDNCDFRCNSGECLGLEYECDGSSDCADGSDETKEKCGKIRCAGFLFQCKYGACIPKNKVCNGEKNCADNSDEETPGCQTSAVAGGCKNSEFRCKNGQCIDNLDTCDGIKTCDDGSDETAEACAGLVCPDFLYRCDYGACVIKSARCNGKIDCVDGSDERGCPTSAPPVTQPTRTTTTTPPPPPTGDGCITPTHKPNGRYLYVNGEPYAPNVYTDSSVLIILDCNPGYRLSGDMYFSCYNKAWLPDLRKGSCIRTCESLTLLSDTFNAYCNLNGQNVSCEDAQEGTFAKLQCRPFYTFHGTRINPLCTNGFWDPYPTPCEPECGEKIVNAEELVIGGSNALEGEYPWIVAIYKRQDKEQQCGGTIISRFFVLSAAHCFANEKGEKFPEENYILVAGKYNRDFNVKEANMQEKDIKRLWIHDDYRGNLQKYRDDIAIVEVDKFEMTLTVKPVCMDWSSKYEDNDFTENNIAVVAGWGFTRESSTPAEVLKKLLVPFRSKEVCKMYMDADFYQQFYASDKICAGYKDNATSVCKGDSGGGLYFRSQPAIFYIRGIVSLTRRANGGCDSNHYALFTKVSKYLSWIEAITRRRV